jgi:hypothetical protein
LRELDLTGLFRPRRLEGGKGRTWATLIGRVHC